MEFADWVVSGLDQLRLGNLPAGNVLYQTAAGGLGGDPRLDAFMNTGDPAARAELVQAIAAAVAANPGFEQQLRDAAAAAQSPAGGVGGQPSFFQTSNGKLALGAAAVVVVGGGIALALGLSGGSGSGNLAAILKGTWSCNGSAAGGQSAGGGGVTFTVGDGTWTAGGESGTWKQSGNTATLHDTSDPGTDIKATGLPSGTGSFNVSLAPAKQSPGLVDIHVKGNLSTTKLTITVPGDGEEDVTFICTKK